MRGVRELANDPVTLNQRIAAHISIMRLDHSIKNIFVLPGVFYLFSYILRQGNCS